MTESTRYIPEDLLVEILVRVPAVSLTRFRSTSKRWNALINDERLTKKHYATAPRQSLFIMLIDFRVYLVSVDLHGIVKVKSQLRLKDPASKFSEEEVDIRNVFHSDGLLLCTTEDNRLVFWNPCSRETRWIQPRNSYKRFDFYALGKSSCNKYKILRIDQYDYVNTCLVESEIYDFTSNSWRGIGKTRDWFIPRCRYRGMSVNGITYWLASTIDFFNGIFLLSFDFSRERFGSESLPGDHLSSFAVSLSVTRDEQQLCMIATRRSKVEDVDIWLSTKIESTGATSWSKFLRVKRAYIHQPFCFMTGMNFLADQENKVILFPGKHGVSYSFLNILGENKHIQVDHHDARKEKKDKNGVSNSFSVLLTYVPNLVQIQQGQKEGKKKRKRTSS